MKHIHKNKIRRKCQKEKLSPLPDYLFSSTNREARLSDKEAQKESVQRLEDIRMTIRYLCVILNIIDVNTVSQTWLKAGLCLS